MFTSHNLRLERKGECDCACHKGASACNCGWRYYFPVEEPPARTVLRSGKLESRVKPFKRLRHPKHHNSRVISLTTAHGFHEPIVIGARK